MQHFGQFFRKIACRRATDECLGRGTQGAVAGDTGRIAGQQTICCEAGDLTKGVKAAAMRVAGQVVEFFQLSENGEVDIRAERSFQTGKGCDFVVEQQLSQRIGGEQERSHNVIVSTKRCLLVETITYSEANWGTARLVPRVHLVTSTAPAGVYT